MGEIVFKIPLFGYFFFQKWWQYSWREARYKRFFSVVVYPSRRQQVRVSWQSCRIILGLVIFSRVSSKNELISPKKVALLHHRPCQKSWDRWSGSPASLLIKFVKKLTEKWRHCRIKGKFFLKIKISWKIWRRVTNWGVQFDRDGCNKFQNGGNETEDV